MTPINSGTSTERILRSLLLCVLVDTFAIWFLYDGYIGYPRKNAEELAKLLGLPTAQVPAPHQDLTSERGRALTETVRAGQPLEKLTGVLGAPAIRQSDAAYFVGPGGWLKADLRGETLVAAKWHDGPHTESDQFIQRLLGWLLVLGGVAAMLNLIRVMMTRAVLNESGLQATGHKPIPYEAMTGFRRSDTSDSWTLEYSASGQSWTLRLDPFLYKQANDIARVIAERKGFTLSS